MSLVSNRAEKLRFVRSFFEVRKVVEVDCPNLIPFPPIDKGVEVMEVGVGENQVGYLHTSPEYAMKRLLARGSDDLYYLGHVFRKGEWGQHHHPEFTMIEWYRIGMPYEQFIQEVVTLISLLLEKELPIKRITYREAFQIYAGFDPFVDSAPGDPSWDRDTRLDLILCDQIEPHLGKEGLTILCEYPASQAALARTIERDGYLVAERFEIYYKGIELANGYHELNDSQEQRKRFEQENATRKVPYPLDEGLLAALDQLPDCCGASVGFDRLMLLRYGQASLSEVLLEPLTSV